MICPDNSTECLLRALLDQGDSFNWNPLNFAFTAATGILALIIACIAVFQGLLAAGPGRLKASRSAIGPWTKLTKSRFDWVELGLRTTAQVPFLRLLYMDNALAPGGRADRRPTDSSAITDVAASWLPLLQRAGLADPYYWETRPSATDYLPADVQAAPASASVLCLVFLALLADTDVVIDYKEGGRFVLVQGATSQLTIREHPILGPVAVYETYGLSSPMPYDAARTSLAFAWGQMTCGEAVLPTRDFFQYSNIDPRVHGERLYQMLLLRYPENAHVQNFSSWTIEIDGSRSFTAFLLILCDLPAGIRSFPCRLLAAQKIIGELFPITPLFSRVERVSAAIEEANSVANRGLPWFESHAIESFQMADYSERKHTNWLLLSESDPRRFRQRWVSKAILKLCSSWVRQIEDERMMATVPFRRLCDNAPRVFLELQHQLRMLDRFLSCYYLDKAASATLSILKSIDADTRGKDFDPFSFYVLNQGCHQTATSDEDEAALRKQEFDNLRVLLTFRAILYAAILDLCADTSFVYGSTWRDSVVKIL
jgi:hypothetical protein